MENEINTLAATQGPEVAAALQGLIEDPALAAWRPHLFHARAEQAKLRRDEAFRHPALAQLEDTLKAGAPMNAADMRAIVVEVLGHLAREIRHGANQPWRLFWNTMSRGGLHTPNSEIDCTRQLIQLLKSELKPYGMNLVLPEAQQANGTRVDVLFPGDGFGNLPLEAKLHWNAEIWTAPEDQLAGYAQSPGADGFGIYVVYWFGSKHRSVPGIRARGGTQPVSSEELRSMIEAEIPISHRPSISVIVLDVAHP